MARQAHHPPMPAGLFDAAPTGAVGYINSLDGVIGFGRDDFHVKVIPRNTAIRVIRAHHYSGRIVANSYIHLGAFLDGKMLGVLQFGYAMNAAAVGKIVANSGPTEHLELNRMWFDDAAPRNSESRALSYAMKYLKRATPRVRWVQSFADERCGRLGVVYQAANFLYLGSHKTTFYVLDGETYHGMLLTAHGKGGRRGRHLRANIARATMHSLRQFRYLYVLKRSARRDLRMIPQPYPKPDTG